MQYDFEKKILLTLKPVLRCAVGTRRHNRTGLPTSILGFFK